MLPWILGFSVLGSLGAIAGAAAVLLFPEAVRKRWLPDLVSYATGTLLGAAFLGMIPTALDQAATRTVTGTVLAGIVLFFVLEKLVLWRHCHQHDCVAHSRPAPLILFGDAFHNFVDGAVIAAAFLSSIPLGVATSLAVIAHEVPQEVGDFGILLDSGYSVRRALLLNVAASGASLIGGFGAYFLLNQIESLLPYVMAISAASFIYIAASDLIPGLHRESSPRHAVQQVLLLIAGAGTIWLFHR